MSRVLIALSTLAPTLTSVACSGSKPPEPAASAGVARSFQVVHVNDTYRIEGVAGAGGMARVRALRASLPGDVLLTHGGDFLGPSFLGRTFNGAQMVDVMNLLDGKDGSEAAEDAEDQLMFVTFGNHEFDDDDMDDVLQLQERMDESEFGWLDNGINWAQNDVGESVLFHERLSPTALVTANGVKVGLYSLTIDKSQPAYVTGFAEPVEAARTAIEGLRSEGAEVVIGITHLAMDDDLAMLEELGDDGPDVVFGGHEHHAQSAEAPKGSGRFVHKGDADALSAVVATVDVAADGTVSVSAELRPLDTAAPADEAVQARVDAWLDRHEVAYCREYFDGEDGCLSKELTTTNTMFEAEELVIRRFETSLGSHASDLALAHYAPQGAQVAFLNSGSMRLNQNLPAGSPITQQVVEELLPYSSGIVLLELDGATLQAVIDHSVEDWTGNGHWLQLAGMAWRHDPDKGKATDLHLLTPEGPVKVKPDTVIKAAVMEYLVNTKYDQDGYTMLKPEMVIAEDDIDLKGLLRADFAANEATGISPAVKGRICIEGYDRPELCLLD